MIRYSFDIIYLNQGNQKLRDVQLIGNAKQEVLSVLKVQAPCPGIQDSAYFFSDAKSRVVENVDCENDKKWLYRRFPHPRKNLKNRGLLKSARLKICLTLSRYQTRCPHSALSYRLPALEAIDRLSLASIAS